MDQRTVRAFCAVAAGVGMGLAIGREVIAWHWLMAWIAPVLGGVVAYVAVDIRSAAAAVLLAVRRTLREMRASLPTRERVALTWWPVLACMSVGSSIASAILVGGALLSDRPVLVSAFPMALLLGTIFGPLMGTMFIAGNDARHPDPPNVRLERYRAVTWYASPIMCAYYTLYAAAFVCRWTGVVLWWCARFFARVAWHWFRIVHSDLRTLCFVSAALFTAAGMVIGGSVFWWMAAGGVFGILEYRVVSVLVLRLAPAPAR